MVKFEIINAALPTIPTDDLEEKIVKPIEQLAQQLGMTVDGRTTLSTKRGSIHWHLTFAKEKGVLEVTYWPKTEQLWLEIHTNRQRTWNLQRIGPYADALAAHFGGQAVQVE